MARPLTRVVERRRLADGERGELRRLIDAVPADATVTHPAVTALLAYRRSLQVPPWAPRLDYRIRIGYIAEGLASLRRLAECEDWGDEKRALLLGRVL